MKIEKLFQLRPREQILEVIRQDFVPALPWWGLLSIWIVAPFFFLFPLLRQGTVGVFFLAALVGAGVFVAIRSRYVWQRTALIITDQRVVDISQHGFFDREIAEVSHADIEEVTYRVKGLWPTVFRYGTLYLRTAGERGDIVFRRAHRPIDLNHLLNELCQEARGELSAASRAQKLKALAARLSDAEVERLAAAVRGREQAAATKDFLQS